MRRTLIIFILLALSLGAQGKTYRVRNVSALKEAIEQAGTGDRIVLRKGIFRLTDTLVVEGKKGITIEGHGAQLNGGVKIPRRALKRCKEVLDSDKACDAPR